MKRLRDLTLFATTLALAVAVVGCKKNGGGDEAKRLEGAGSSFVDPMMQEWAEAYKNDKKTEINYQSKGSGAGISMMTRREVDFGCSDAPLNDEQIKKANDEGGE